MSIIITATCGELKIRAIGSYTLAVQRARELFDLGWDVQLHDDAGNPVAWSTQRPSEPASARRTEGLRVDAVRT
jgi:hypothetical protein